MALELRSRLLPSDLCLKHLHHRYTKRSPETSHQNDAAGNRRHIFLLFSLHLLEKHGPRGAHAFPIDTAIIHSTP